MKAQVHATKKFFSRQEKNIAPVAPPKPKPKKFTVTKQKSGVAFGTFSRVKKVSGRTDLSASAEHHRARVAGREETREQLRHKAA